LFKDDVLHGYVKTHLIVLQYQSYISWWNNHMPTNVRHAEA